MKTSRAGGIISGLLTTICLLILFGIIAADYIARNVRVEHVSTFHGQRTRVETPVGSIGIDARDSFNPESAGVPVYPHATRDKDGSGAALVDLDWNAGAEKHLSIVGAGFTTTDSVEQVRDFYRDHLPHWMFTSKGDDDCHIEFTKGGYKRIVSIEERHGRTHIGVVSIGESAVN